MSAAVRLGTFTPGSPEWVTTRSTSLGASDIAAVLRLSPWQSAFSLWHEKRGVLTPEPDTEVLRRGRLLEPVVAAWFAEQHPEYKVRRTGTWANRARPWQIATPDRLLHALTGRAVLEIKTATDPGEWGEPGTGEIPIHYRCQVLWQLDTLGLTRGHVAVLTSGLEFREYVVEWNIDEVELLRAAGREFLDTIDRDERPDIDTHGATYRAVRLLHPDIADVEVEIAPGLAEHYRAAVAAHKQAEQTKQQATARVMDALGTGRRAVVDGESIAIRVPGRAGGPPSLRPSPIRMTPQKVSAAA
ncbi:YqaJ viral recombinase family protein [Actinocrispum wychmicini]|uniref:Putative phage-type endonuclease n=1 Tax=Actinocrispum wychmicini TaxID=1213861 RepID=A0A4R2JV80_9PSEU|nr:YqaJ viral recombinase family protein [Actinocrispum wychmicini]TCO64361.1 putative phage-type endonuclease [Actinocrispum wychmicini]